MVQHIIVVHGNEKFRIRPCRCGAGFQCISSSITRLTWSVRMRRMCVARRALSAYTDSTIEGTRATAEVFLRYVILLLLSLAWFPTLGNITVTP